MLRAAQVDDPAAQDSRLDHANEQLADAREELEEEKTEELEERAMTSPLSWRERFTRLRWKRIALTALTLFVVSLVLITAFELLAGRSVSSITGGSDSGDTTIGQVGGGNSGGGDQQDPRTSRPDPPAPARRRRSPLSRPKPFAIGEPRIARRLDGPHRVADDDSLADTRADHSADDNALTFGTP